MKILNFGSCNIDHVYSLDHIVTVGETETTHRFETFPGGKGLNQSIAVARAGAKVYHAGCVGCDAEMLTDILYESGVDLTYLDKTDEKNGHAVIQVSKRGENSIFLYPGSNEMVEKQYIDRVLDNFNKGDIILLQNEISNVDYIIEKAYQKQMCIILNPSPINEKLEKIDFSKLTYIVLNEVEAKEISGIENPEESLAHIKKQYPSLKILLTLGVNGCIYSDEETEVRQSSFVVDAVDTTAAGDTFTGYFVAGLSENEDYKRILTLSCAAAAISVSRKGAAPSIPDKAEVVSAIKTLKEYKSNSKINQIFKKINNYVEQNIKTVNLKEMSEFLGYSPGYTGSLVKRVAGMSFTDLVQKKRCDIAAEKLLHTDLSVKEIISELGYENESFFRKVFKEKYGDNPLHYRKKGE